MRIQADHRSYLYKRLVEEKLEWMAADGSVDVDDDAYQHFRVGIEKSYPMLSFEQKNAEAVVAAYTHANAKKGGLKKAKTDHRNRTLKQKVILLLIGAILGAIFCALTSVNAHGQITYPLTCRATAAAPTFIEGQMHRLSCDLTGTLRTSAGAGGSGGTSSNFGAAFPTAGTAIGAKFGANMVNLAADASSNLLINCAVGCGAAGFTDNGAWSFGVSSINPIAGVFDDVATNNCTENSACIARITADKMLYMNLGKYAGTAVGAGNAIHVQPGTSSVWDISDRAARLLGRIYGSQGQQILQTATNFNTQVELAVGATLIDPRVITTFPDNEPFNVAQFGGAAVATGAGAGGAGIPRVTVSNDSSILGTKTNNNAAPGATNFGSLGCLANAATPSWTEGNLVLCSVDLSGLTRIRGNSSDNGAAATSNRLPTLAGIYESTYNAGTAGTVGRDSAQSHGSDGLLWVAQLPSLRPASYSASSTVAPAASATDIARFPGNATTDVLVTKVKVSCTQTTAGIIVLNIISRSTAGSGGTSANMTVIKDHTNYSAASSTPVTYTANPTVGTVVGNIDTYKLGCLAPGTAAANDIYILNRQQKPFVLTGTGENLTVNLNGATVTGGSVALTFEWIEITHITP